MGTTNKFVRDAECAQPSSHCREVADTLARIGDKWTVMVVAALSMGEPLRYNEISRKVDGISQRMLTLTLQGLEQDGFVSRTMYPTIPPREEFAQREKIEAPRRAAFTAPK